MTLHKLYVPSFHVELGRLNYTTRLIKTLLQVLQESEGRGFDVFDISYYNVLKKYLTFVGLYPSHAEFINKIKIIVLASSSISLIIPTLLQFSISMHARDWDAAIESIPHLVTTSVGLIKMLSLYFNRKNFRKVFVNVEKDWQLLLNSEIRILDEITGRGSRIAQVYRNSILSFLVVFVLLPLINPVLDVVLPMNETRPQQQIFNLYYFVNNEEHFYSIYFHSCWCSFVTIVAITTVDCLNMTITHHASALFAICGYKIKKMTENNNVATKGHTSMDNGYQEIKECVVAHSKAIQFFNFLDKTNRKSFLVQVGLNMIAISVTAFQIVMHLEEPDLAMRYAIFCGGQKFHLFFLSLPGQILVEHSLEVTNSIYNSKWYHTSLKMQKILNIMQIRACKPCMLTAGGLYEMNIENFGKTVKTCMSYFTMLLSMKD